MFKKILKKFTKIYFKNNKIKSEINYFYEIINKREIKYKINIFLIQNKKQKL